jgi:HAMP domain-containing protein
VPGSRPLLLRISAPLSGGIAGGGWLRLACDGSALAEAIQPQELGAEADLALADRSGRVLLGGGVSTGSNSLAAFPAALVEQALPGRSEGASRFRDANGTEVLGAYSPIPETDWVVLSRQPARVAEAVAGELRRRSLLALGAALLLIAGLSAAAWFAVVRPVRELAAAQRELAGAGAPATTGRNEIEDLRRGFEALRRGIAERRALDDVFLGRYQVLELLATGGMGSVFRGWDPKLQRPVALKTLRLGVDLPEETRRSRIEQLVREAVTAARFSHPNVVAVYDVEDAPEGAFIAMELVEGISLERLLLRRGRLAPGEVLPLGVAIARGLAAAHARDIVHRDVKPANVMLGRDGSIKVTDFGIADLVAAASQADDRVFGTPGYLPPESLRGQGQGRAGDLFALGVVLYECLSGAKPFGGLEASDVVQATLFGTVRPLKGRSSGEVPPELESIVLLLLERDPGRRPSAAAAVAEELERLAAAQGLRWKLDEGGGGGHQSTAAPSMRPEIPSVTVEAQWVPTMAVLQSTGSARPVR